jgi:GntR family transcriptional regulator/MocR family aminotransferase
MLIPLKLVRDQRLQQQLFEQLRDLIVSNRLRPGSRMPSTRMLAEQFAISRVTVLLTYERLIAEGYLDTRPAAGTFVADPPTWAQAGTHVPPTRQERLAAWVPEPEARVGSPDPSLFPAGRWRSLMRAGLDRMGVQRGSEHPAGIPALRDAVARWLSTSRGLAVTAEQVMLVRGRQQALHVAAYLASHASHGTRRARVVVEDPCDPQASAALAIEPERLVRVPVDADGLCTHSLPEIAATLIHVTPEHQRPLGVTLSHERRLALLYWASRSGALILEEDCEGELRYGDMHARSLMSLDTAERVVLFGGFCVSLGPMLDMAYMALPRRLIAAGMAARRLIDDSRNSLEQMALAEFLDTGGYARHLHRLTKTYAARRDTLLATLRRELNDPVATLGYNAGLHLAWFPRPDIGSPEALAALARRCGIEAAAQQLGPRGAQTVLLGFGLLSEHQIETRVARFGELARLGTRAEPSGLACSAASMPALS